MKKLTLINTLNACQSILNHMNDDVFDEDDLNKLSDDISYIKNNYHDILLNELDILSSAQTIIEYSHTENTKDDNIK